MVRKLNNISSNKPGGGRYAALAILVILGIVVGSYLYFTPESIVPPTDIPVSPKSTLSERPSTQFTPQAQISAPKLPHKQEKVYPPVTTPPVEKPQVTRNHEVGQLAIIIDDMGTNLQEARSLAGIGVPLTFSIIPGLRSYREVATFSASNGIEIMIHIPMQSKGWPERRLESNGLLVSMTDSDIVEHIEGFMRNLPKAVGANNHMGSEFTEHEDKMRVVLELLKSKGLFYVDSVTTPGSVGEKLAKELGVKSGHRQVFLDNEQNEHYIMGQLNQAVRLAKKTGTVIAICHPHSVTLRTLEAALPGLVKQGISLVPVSKLIR